MRTSVTARIMAGMFVDILM